MISKKDANIKKGKQRSLKQIVQALHDSKLELYDAEGALEIKRALFEKNNADLLLRAENAKTAVSLNDETLRNYLVEQHGETGGVSFGPGLDIRMRSALQVHDAYALRQWAFDNMPIALEVDLAIIKLAVEGLPDRVHGAFIAQVPTPYITKDLQKTLDGLGAKHG